MLENSTKLATLPFSSPPARTRTVVSTIYIAGIAFMVGVFLVLLWVNLFSRYCWCWHDTSVSNRFNHQWFIQRSNGRQNENASSKDRRTRRQSEEDELE
ncbi:unnamed protein product [Adineta ricciae]|uniref:Uncharacterized protein n=1 Tax=Adineta ricciae TaxID=249248 RepID=A0A815VY70_ADIRI|nr:unnamed protein product [Adineta ricciae]